MKVYKYKEPLNEAESNARFTMHEDNGDRALMALVCDLPIAPVCLVKMAEMIEVN